MIESFLNYAKYSRGFSENSIIKFQKGLKRFESFLNERGKTADNPEKILLLDICDFIAKMRIDWLCPWSCNAILDWVKAYFKWLRDILERDVLDAKKIKGCKMPARKIGYFNKEEKNQILNIVKSWMWVRELTKLRNKLLTYMLLHTGLRCYEIAKIKVNEIWENLQVIGKWGKRRFVYLRPEILDMIKSYLKKRKNNSEFLFNGRRDTNHLKTWSIRNIFIKMTRMSGIHIHAHKFRHTFCTDLLHVPWANIYAVSKLMWHSKITTTQIYLGVDNQELKSLQFWLKFS